MHTAKYHIPKIWQFPFRTQLYTSEKLLFETNSIKLVYFSSFVLKYADYSGKNANFAAQYKNYIQTK